MKAKNNDSKVILMITLIMLIISVVAAAFILKGFSDDAQNAVYDKDGYSFTAQEIDDTLWMIGNVSRFTDSSEVSLNIHKPENAGCAMLMRTSAARDLTINGERPEQIVMDSYSLIELPNESDLNICFLRDSEKIIMTRIESIYFGSKQLIQEKALDLKAESTSLQGFFLFSILFSLALYAFKPTEKYLLFFAAHASLPILLGANSALGHLLPTVSYAFSLIETSFVYQYGYILLNGAVHWLLYREFVNDKIANHSYIVYLLGATVLFTAVTAVIPEWCGGYASYPLYLIMYLLEGIILFLNRRREHYSFVPVLIAGWFFSLIFWTVRAANNMGYIDYPFSVGSYIAIGYTVSFLLCIMGKFAYKFTQADRLLLKTKQLNAELSELNDSLEQKVNERTADLQQAMESLEKTQASKNQLMTNIIHNLKSPLFSLKGYAELLKEKKETEEHDDEEVSYLTHICSNVDYLQDMVKQLLLFDRLEEKKITFHIVTVNLAGMLSRLESAVYASLREKEITLRIQNDTEPDLTIDVDEFYIKQAIVCILDNAIRFSNKHSFIDLHAYSGKDGYVSLTVTDYGKGMSPQVCAQIFERGYTHHENGEKSSGLGLNIALEIVREHGGTISVRSEENIGSTFTIELPLITTSNNETETKE